MNNDDLDAQLAELQAQLKGMVKTVSWFFCAEIAEIVNYESGS